MRGRPEAWLIAAFGALLATVVLSTWSVVARSAQIDRETARVYRIHEEADDALTDIRSGVYRAALLVRGFLLGMAPEAGLPLPQELAGIHNATDKHLHKLDSLLGPQKH